MKVAVEELGLGLPATWITPSSASFRPSTWPPSRDWPVSIDRDGTVVSRWGDPIWDLTPLAGKTFKLNFGDGAECKTDPLDPENADLLRIIITWRMWGHRSLRAPSTLQAAFTRIRGVIALCSRNGILASELMRFPRVLEQLPEIMAPSRFDIGLTELHRLYDARDALGFVLVDLDGLKRLAAARPNHDTIQTPYIPPRIWVYQLSRLRECLDDFLSHQEQIEACFRFCLGAYAANYGSLPAALLGNKSYRGPFNKNCQVRIGCTYAGTFADTAERYGILKLLERWISPEGSRLTVRAFSAYLSLVNVAGLAYIANFTLQRKEEVASLRSSCLLWEEDEKLGRVPIICGETTKTDQDSDARWVASPSIEVAIKVMTAIARLRMTCDRENAAVAPTPADMDDPYLFSVPSEPWGSGKHNNYAVRKEADSLAESIENYPMLFDLDQIRITEEDLKITRRLTPNLPDHKFAVGSIWPLAWHQYRRTGAVNMFSTGLISDSTMQQQMKHCSRLMPLYYGRGYSRLHLNENVEAAVITAMYEAMALQITTALGGRFVSPHSEERKHSVVVNLVSGKDAKTLVNWAKSGKVSYREHRLGGCMKAGACEYGGVESVARCAGGDGGKPCVDVLFDRAKEPQIRRDLQRVSDEMARLPKDSPRYKALQLDRKGMENYLNVIQNN
jgi:hypothetical protein